jgi:hypothetical protein
MADQTAKITVDDIVAAAGAGALRAMSARGGAAGDRELSIEKLVSAGFGVRFEIWAGGWPGPWGPNGLPGNLPGSKGGIGS